MFAGILAICVSLFTATVHAQPGGRTFAASNYNFSFNAGDPVNPIKGLSGGDVAAEIVSVSVGAARGKLKSIGTLTISPIDLKFLFISPIVSKAMNQFLQGNGSTSEIYNPVITECDFNGQVISATEYKDAMISGFTFPALNAADKTSAAFGLQVTAASLNPNAGLASGKCDKTSIGTGRKTMSAANFQVTLDGIDTAGVISVSAIQVKQKMQSAALGSARIPGLNPTEFSIENFEITFSANKAGSIDKWFTQTVIDQQLSGSSEKNLTLALKDPTLKDTLAELVLTNVGVFKRVKNTDLSVQTTATVTYSFYAEAVSGLSIK